MNVRTTERHPVGSVWAPDAEQVRLVVDGRARSLRQDGEWWVNDEPLAAGTRYSFDVDGRRSTDPRSRWQPDGPEGDSAVDDPSTFEWTDDGWQPPAWRDAVLYEIHVGTFSEEGTFEGAVAHLDEVAALGATHVELMPVNAWKGRFGWGYDGVCWWSPHPAYGSPHDLRTFVQACHSRGLGVVLDVVYNHFGPVGAAAPGLGPYLTAAYRTPWGPAINLDGPGSDEVRAFICENAAMWIRDHHVDGLRLDACHALIDTSSVHLVEALGRVGRQLSHELGRHVALVAEWDRNDPRGVDDPARGGYGLTAHWADELHHALHVATTGEHSGYYQDFTEGDIAEALAHAYVARGRYSRTRGRTHGRSPEGRPSDRFVVALQNHDQIGNRARGERLHHLVGEGPSMAAATLLLLAPYVPLIFQGEDWAASSPFPYFADHRGDLAEAVRRGRFEEFAAFGWTPDQVPDPVSAHTFERARLDRSEIAQAPHATVRDWYQQLLALRRGHAELRGGGERPVVEEHDRLVVMRRGRFRIAANLSDRPRIVDHGDVVLAMSGVERQSSAEVRLPAGTAAVLADPEPEPAPGSGRTGEH